MFILFSIMSEILVEYGKFSGIHLISFFIAISTSHYDL